MKAFCCGCFLVAVALASCVSVASALDNGVGRRPSMGFNTWYDDNGCGCVGGGGGGDNIRTAKHHPAPRIRHTVFRYSVFMNPTEQICNETLVLLQSLGFRDAGYEYL